MAPRHVLPFVVPLALITAGTVGYSVIEDWPVRDSFYMTVITLSTVGFSEVHPLSEHGREFTVTLVLGGVFALFYVATEGMRAIFGGEVQKLLGRQRMEKNLAALEDHLLVCGFGRVGHLVCDEFSSHGLPFVVMDKDAGMLADFDMPHGIAVTGDATSDEDLKHVGVERARALVAALPSDAGNVYITMSARFLNPELYIVARAEGEAADKKLLRAGANRVVSPYRIGGQRVAQAVLRPAVIDFIDLATSRSHLELQIEETQVMEGSSLIGQPLRSSGLRRELGIILVAIMKPGGSSVFNPSGEMIIQENDVLIGLGSRSQLDRLEAIAGAREPAKG